MKKLTTVFLSSCFFLSFCFNAFAFNERDSSRNNNPGRDSSFSVRKISDVRQRFMPKKKYFLDYIQNQNAAAQDGSFWIGGNGIVNGNMLIGTSTDAGFKLNINGNTRSNQFWASDYIEIQKTFGVNYGIRLADPSGGFMTLGGVSSAGFSPGITMHPSPTWNYSSLLSITSDAGTYPAILLDGRTSSGALTTQDVLWIGSYLNPYVKVKANGNFLVGTTTDAGYKLDVNGIGRFGNRLDVLEAVQGSGGIRSYGSSLDNNWGGGIEFLSANGTSVRSKIVASVNGMMFYTANTERARITGDGKLLVGYTTSQGNYPLQVNGGVYALSYSLNPEGQTNRLMYNVDRNKVYISKTTYASLGHLHVKDMDQYANVLDPSLALATFDVNGENVAQMGSNQVYNATSVNVNASSMPLTGTAVFGQYLMKGIEVRARQQATTSYQSPYSANSQAFGIKITSINDDGGYWSNGSYGLYIDATSAKANTAYAIYSNTGLNYFADKLLVGNIASQGDFKLQVSGGLLLNSQTTEPMGTNGGMVYNSSTNQFKGYRNGHWKNFLMDGDASSGSAGGWQLGGNTNTNSSSNFIGTTDNQALSFRTSNLERLVIDANGNIAINAAAQSNYKLAVNGDAIFTKVKVKQYPWSDYVFNTNYKLPSLKEVEEYIKQNKHLPDVPSEEEVQKNGLDVGDNQAVLLKKIEELTLYIINQDKKIEKLETQNKELSDIKKELELIKSKLQIRN